MPRKLKFRAAGPKITWGNYVLLLSFLVKTSD
jgi:hypothetical protein